MCKIRQLFRSEKIKEAYIYLQTLAQIVSLLLVTLIHSSLPLLVSNGHVLVSMSNGVTSHDLVLHSYCISNSFKSSRDHL